MLGSRTLRLARPTRTRELGSVACCLTKDSGLGDARLRVHSVRARKLVPAAVALVALGLASPRAAASTEQRLADRYAPIAALADQERPCSGEAWRPVSVDIVLDNPKVTLHGPGKGSPVVKRAPAAADLFGRGEGYFLDFPGNPLRPRCTYDRDGKRFALGKPSIAYAHITEHGDAGNPKSPQRLALQYWFSTTSTISTTSTKQTGKESSSCSRSPRRVRRY
jgi:hypothetical protein